MTAALERQAAACIFASFPGPEAPDWIRAWLGRGLGGIVLFADNVVDRARAAALVDSLRAERPELVVAIDEEGGDVTRLEAASGSSYPGNLALGVVDDTDLTEGVAGAIAAELTSIGVTMNLAPVTDVNSNSRNPVIGVRSFGSEPDLVARHVAAFVAGTQRVGVAACAKHFPGHGDTAVDSHLELPTVEGDLRQALVPFRAAIEARVASVMIGHLLVPQLDDVPATLSARIVSGLLRDELGFDGMVVSDALEMRAISGTAGIEEGALMALEAGVDALCLGRLQGEDVVESVHEAILGAVRSGQLSEGRVTEAAQRIGHAAQPAPGQIAPDRALGLAAARRALRIEGDVALRSPPLVVELQPEPSIAAGPGGQSLGAAVSRRLPGTDVIALRDGAEPFDPPDDRPLVLVLRDAARHDWQQELATALAPAVIVETGLPGWRPDGVSAWIETNGAGRVNLEAAAEVLVPDLEAEADAIRPLALPDSTLPSVRMIVVAYDDPASVTLERAAELAESVGAELIITNVTAAIEAEDTAEAARRAQAKLEEARRRLAGRDLPIDFVPIVGPPGEGIVRLADERGADLIVVGTRKKGFLERLVEGSVNQEVLRRASCDVLVVHK